MSASGTGRAHGGRADPAAISRREAVRRIALLLGGAMVGSQAYLSGQPVPGKASPGFTQGELALMDEIGETIIPATDIPGAKAAGIGAFMAMMVTDCYDDRHHAAFREGLSGIEAAARERCRKPFLECSREERTALANALDAEQRADQGKRGKDATPHYFRMMKELSVLGFFSSEIGCTRALRYIEVPGSFNGNYPYRKGDRAWF